MNMKKKKIEACAKSIQDKYKNLLQHKTLELLLYDMVGTRGVKETRDILKWWHDRLDEF